MHSNVFSFSDRCNHEESLISSHIFKRAFDGLLTMYRSSRFSPADIQQIHNCPDLALSCKIKHNHKISISIQFQPIQYLITCINTWFWYYLKFIYYRRFYNTIYMSKSGFTCAMFFVLFETVHVFVMSWLAYLNVISSGASYLLFAQG